MVKSTIIVLSILAAARAVLVLNETTLGDGCTVSDYSKVDAAVKSCTTLVINDMTVPAGKTLKMDLQTGTKLTFKGSIKFGHKEWSGPLIEIKGENLDVTGEPGHVIDGEGAKYWDGQGGKGSKKPKLFRINGASGKFSNINILNCPTNCISVAGKYLTLTKWYVDVSAGDKNKLGHNTDGFDVSSSDHLIIDDCVVKNQDDCVAVNSGKNLLFNKLACSGGHGLSLSVGQNKHDPSKNHVENVTFSNCVVSNSANAIHVKTHADSPGGYIKDLTYRNIQVSGITNYGINVQQDYKNGGSSGIPSSNILISNLKMDKIQGTMGSSRSSMSVYILCGSTGCKDFNWSEVSITGAKKKNKCNFHPSGFNC